MNALVDVDKPTRVIMHFRQDEERAQAYGTRIVYLQVTIDPDPSWFDPKKEFIRFDHKTSEVHGWVPIEDVVIDSVLATMEGMEGEEEIWKAA